MGAFIQEKALVGAFSMIVKTDCEIFTNLRLKLSFSPLSRAPRRRWRSYSHADRSWAADGSFADISYFDRDVKMEIIITIIEGIQMSK